MFGEPRHVSTATLRNSFERRSVLIGGLQVGVGVLLAVRMGWIGVVQNAKYATASESNRVNLTLIPPRRGWIVDRYGKALADNRVALRVERVEFLLQPFVRGFSCVDRAAELADDRLVSDRSIHTRPLWFLSPKNVQPFHRVPAIARAMAERDL